MRELALFAGAGGGLLGSCLLGWKTVCAVEIEEYPRRVLLARQKDGILPQFPIWDDVRTLDGREWRGRVDIVTGGDPCQDNSAAAPKGSPQKSLGAEYLQIVEDVRPAAVLRENPAVVRRNAPWPAERFADGLESLGYEAEIVKIEAYIFGYKHRRKRAFVIGVAPDADSFPNVQAFEEILSDGKSLLTRENACRGVRREQSEISRILSESDVRRSPYGVAGRVDRLKAIGNGQVPEMVECAWETLETLSGIR